MVDFVLRINKKWTNFEYKNGHISKIKIVRIWKHATRGYRWADNLKRRWMTNEELLQIEYFPDDDVDDGEIIIHTISITEGPGEI